MLKGGDPKAMLLGHESAEDNAASQQTLFIVSGSPSNLIQEEVTQMPGWGHNSPGS